MVSNCLQCNKKKQIKNKELHLCQACNMSIKRFDKKFTNFERRLEQRKNLENTLPNEDDFKYLEKWASKIINKSSKYLPIWWFI